MAWNDIFRSMHFFLQHSKYFNIKPNIIKLGNNIEEPMFDLTLGVETLSNIGVVLDFGKRTITIDHVSNLTKEYTAVKNTIILYHITQEGKPFPWPALEPISTCGNIFWRKWLKTTIFQELSTTTVVI